MITDKEKLIRSAIAITTIMVLQGRMLPVVALRLVNAVSKKLNLEDNERKH